MTLIVKNHPRKNFFRKNVVISIPYFYCIVKKTMQLYLNFLSQFIDF